MCFPKLAPMTCLITGAAVQIDYLTPEDAAILLEFVLSDGDISDLEGVPLLVTENLSAGTSAFTCGAGKPTIFVPEDENEYNVT